MLAPLFLPSITGRKGHVQPLAFFFSLDSPPQVCYSLTS